MIKGKQDKIFNGSWKTNPWLDGNTTALKLEDPVRVWEGYWEHGNYKAVIAQSVERVPFKHVVLGSSPSNGRRIGERPSYYKEKKYGWLARVV